MKLQDRVALISGGNSGIGRATAVLFAKEGARVSIVARDETRGSQTLEEIAKSGGQAIFLACDIRKAGDCQKAVERTIEAFGRLDILVNNAGVIYPGKTVVDTTEEEWDRTMEVNVKGAYLMSRYAIPWMVKNGGGVIINTASVWGLVGGKGAAAYCASKGAMVLLTKAMALDHASQNIRVNCICPGSVDTPMLRQEMEELGGVEKLRPVFESKHPLGRICTPEEVAKAALYLASDDSTFVTGCSLVIDGGRTAGG
ncbi:MAG: SDR family oxidoreductase [Chloroflexi bacterium]|nr:SDR family oxidoreductase [Chloroflexota bacterium]